MNTSQGNVLSYLLYAATYVVALSSLAPLGGLRSRSTPAVLLWLVVAVPSVIGLVVPAVYSALSRRPEAIRDGQLWRLVTSMVVQDGGVVGTVYNLVTLALVAAVALTMWRWWVAVLVFLVGGIGFDLAATFLWNDAGAGNSAATFVLLTATLAAWRHTCRDRRTSTAMGVLAVIGLVLTVIGDAHGTAVLGGLVVGAAIAALDRGQHAGTGVLLRD